MWNSNSWFLPLAFVSSVMLSGCGQSGQSPKAGSTLTASSQNGYESELESVKVLSCHDGDTCLIRQSDGSKGKVRLIGVDAPEVSGGDDGSGQPLGFEARDQLSELVKGKQVQLRAIKLDKYDRKLSEIYLGSVLVNVEMVKKGFAETYIWSDAEIDADRYEHAERQAKNAHRGIWSLDDYESPGDFRARNRAGDE